MEKKGLGISWTYIVLVTIVAGLTLYFQVNETLHQLVLGMIASAVVIYVSFQLLKIEKLFNALIFLAPISFSIDLIGGFSLKTPLEVLTILLIFVFVIKLLMGLSIPKFKWSHPAVILVLLDLSWTLVSAFQSELVGVSVKRFVLKLMFIVGFFFLATYIVKNRKDRLYSLFGFGLILPIVFISVMHAQYGFSQNTSFSISKPFFDDHTQYGAIVAFVIPFFLLNLKKENGRLNVPYILITLLLFVAVITSYSRGAWISLLAALSLFILLKFNIKFRTIFLLVATGILVLTMNFATIYDDLRQNEVKYADDVSQHLTSVTNLQNDASNLERINRWVCAYRMFEAKPIFGYGPGTYQFFYDLYQTPEYMTRISTHKGDKGNAHSEFFNALSEQGLVGGVINLLLMIYMVFLGMKTYYEQHDPRSRKVVLAALLGLVTFYVHGLFNTFSDIAEMSLLVHGSMSIIIYYQTNAAIRKT